MLVLPLQLRVANYRDQNQEVLYKSRIRDLCAGSKGPCTSMYCAICIRHNLVTKPDVIVVKCVEIGNGRRNV